MLDTSSFNILKNLTVSYTGHEAVHFRCASTYNTLQYSSISFTGRYTNNMGFGEDVYIGTVISNWGSVDCLNNGADYSHYNQIMDNVLGPNVTAECIDLKEGTSGGLIRGNKFDGNALSNLLGSFSWINCKGTNYTITQNSDKNSIQFGYRERKKEKG